MTKTQTMQIIARNTEPKYLRDPAALFETWVSEPSRAMKFDHAAAERIQGALAGRFETWLEDA